MPPEGGRATTFDRWSRPPALSRRGYAIALVGPFVLAAALFGLVSLVSSGSDTLTGTTVRLPVSGWAPTSTGGDAALISGVLAIDAEDCVYLSPLQRGGNEPDRVWVVWPAGYRARLDQGRLTVYDADNRPVAHDGDTVRMSGGFTSADTYGTEPCLPESGDVAVVQSDVSVQQ